MNTNLGKVLERLKEHLEKDFDADNYVKSGQADQDIELIKAHLTELPQAPKDCGFNHYREVRETCEKCEKHETCARFKALEEKYKQAMNECYAAPYLEGRYNGD